MIILHTLCSLLSYAAFLTAFVAGILFLIQERQLKRKRMGWLFHRLPALGTLERLNYAAIGIGFVLLTVGLVCGFIGVRALFGRWWNGDPKEALTLLLWLSYLVLWLVRVRATLRGRRIALWSILGFTLVLFTLVGAGWALHSWHPYGPWTNRLG